MLIPLFPLLDQSLCQQSRSIQSRPVRHLVACKNCGQSILGVRYQCSDCSDYNLCAGCEGLPIPVHPTKHTMLKIRTAEPSVLRMSSVQGFGNLLGGQVQTLKAKQSRNLLRKPRF